MNYVMDLSNGKRTDVPTQGNLEAFMWGRQFARYALFTKSPGDDKGQLVPWPAGQELGLVLQTLRRKRIYR